MPPVVEQEQEMSDPPKTVEEAQLPAVSDYQMPEGEGSPKPATGYGQGNIEMTDGEQTVEATVEENEPDMPKFEPTEENLELQEEEQKAQ